jgi:hypothetical protein
MHVHCKATIHHRLGQNVGIAEKDSSALSGTMDWMSSDIRIPCIWLDHRLISLALLQRHVLSLSYTHYQLQVHCPFSKSEFTVE